MGMVGVVMVVALPRSEMPLCSWEWWGAAPALVPNHHVDPSSPQDLPEQMG